MIGIQIDQYLSLELINFELSRSPNNQFILGHFYLFIDLFMLFVGFLTFLTLFVVDFVLLMVWCGLASNIVASLTRFGSFVCCRPFMVYHIANEERIDNAFHPILRVNICSQVI